MSLVSDKKAEIVFSWDARSLTLSTRNEEIGESTETLPVFLKGSPGSLVFNTDQIRTLLQVCQGETMRMDAVMDTDPAKSSSMPSIWSCAEEPDSRYVIMPLEAAD
jgi:DNA polymerase-3 subunit beta